LHSSQWLLVEGWAVVFTIFAGWGALVRWLWRAPVRADPGEVLLCFWIGWATVLLVLQLWHVAFPVDDPARWAVAAVGALGIPMLLRPAWRLLPRMVRGLPALVLFALAAVWLSNRALDGPRFGDAGGYYIPAIRWIIEHRLIIGLANLYPPYAYNQTYFLYAALLDGGPFAGHAHHLLNSMLLATLAARTVIGLWRVCWRRPSAVDVFWTLMLPAEAEAATGYLFTSPAPDFGVYALGIALMGELVAVMASRASSAPVASGGSALRRHFLSLALLAALAPTVKLPLVGLAGGAMIVGTAVWVRQTRRRWGGMVSGLLLAALFGALSIGPWVARNILMSGSPMFPSSFAALSVPWRPNWDVQKWIQNTMVIGDWNTLMHDPRWVAQRFVALGWTHSSVSVPVGITLGALALGTVAAAVHLARRAPAAARDRRMPIALLLPPFASLAVCIATTPVPRYAGATMWLIAAASVMVALGRFLLTGPARAAVAVGAIGLTALPFVTGAPLWLDLRTFALSPRTTVVVQRLASGLDVNVPSPNPACWDAPLPCTPQLHSGLRLRHPPDLSSGFEVDPASPPPGPVTLPGVR
jgi:hypothetical protein